MSTFREHTDYSPGGLTTRAKARINGRKGGIASGRRRRQLAPGRRAPRQRTRDAALALVFPHRQPTRRKFDAAYEQAFPRPERPQAAIQWERGRDTCWAELVCLWRLYRVRGQHACTTNRRLGVALTRQGRPRCRRTIQYTHRRLKALGYVAVHHYKNQRDKPGHKDHLVVEIRTRTIQLCTLPRCGSGNQPEVGLVPTGASEKRSRKRPADNDLSPPPTAADDHPADERPELPGTEKEMLEAELSFLELKQQMGWTSPQIPEDLHRVKLRLRLLATEAGEDPRSRRPG